MQFARKAIEAAVTQFREARGIPVRLRETLDQHPEACCQVSASVPTIGAELVPRWDLWGLGNTWRSHGNVHLYSNGTHGRPSFFEIPEITDFTVELEEKHWACDIRDVEGLAASKSDLNRYTSMDEFAEARTPDWIQEISESALKKNLAHHEVRIMRTDPERKSDFFAEFSWDSDRTYLINSGGSHHFAAARYIAGRLGIEVPLSGRRKFYRFNTDAVRSLCEDFDLYLLPLGPACDAFHVAMERFKATFCTYPLPRPYEDSLLVFLPLSETRSVAVADLLDDVGIFNMGNHLIDRLAQQSPIPETASPCAH